MTLKIEDDLPPKKVIEPKEPKTLELFVGSFVICALVVLSYLTLRSYVDLDIDYFRQDRQEQSDNKDKDKKKDKEAPLKLEGCYLVFILENQSVSAEQAIVLRAAPDFVEHHKMIDFRRYDDDSDEAVPFNRFAEDIGLSSPFVAFVKDKKIIRAEEFPSVESFIKGLPTVSMENPVDDGSLIQSQSIQEPPK